MNCHRFSVSTARLRFVANSRSAVSGIDLARLQGRQHVVPEFSESLDSL
jgi:hypothetical protein